MLRRSSSLMAAVAVLLAVAGPLAAQGLLVVIDREPVPLPRPMIRPPRAVPVSYSIKELAVNARITDQVARVQVSQSFVNTGSRQMEVQFVFPLPYDGAIDQLTLLVDGKEYPGDLLPADKARNIYEGYVRRNQDPALLEWMGHGMFKTSVFPVPAGAERKVTLQYNQLMKKDHGLSEFLFPLSTAKYTSKAVEKVAFRATIESSQPIKNVYSPSHSIEIERPDSTHAVVKFEATKTIPTADFRLFYDVGSKSVGTSVMSYRPDKQEDGYFLLLASPEIRAEKEERPAKTVVFVVDRSGSMSGKKIEQARESLKFVLNNLRDGDLFNIVAYDAKVETFKPELQRFNKDTRAEAIGFANAIQAGGATNIDGALNRALSMLKDKNQPSYVVFLTDGLPTSGETGEAKIVANSKQVNDVRARIVSFGVGYDVNSRLLDRLSRANHGQSEYVRPDEDIEEAVSKLYKKISSPIMSQVQVAFQYDQLKAEEGNPINRRSPAELNDLFEGQQLVLVGRYRKPGAVKVTVTGEVGDNQESLEFSANLVDTSGDESYAFVEKIWAQRRIGDIIDEIDLQGKNEELVKELVALSTKHGILTPYTSFLADDIGTVNDLAAAAKGEGRVLEEAEELTERLKEAGGRAGFGQRVTKQQLQQSAAAPKPSAFGGFAGGGAKFRDVEDAEKEATGLRTIGNKTVYQRGKVWVDTSAADAEMEKIKDKIKKIKRFSKEYFDLVKNNTASENQVLALQQEGEELLIKLRGEYYQIN